jgi:2'-5' RNA ligase
MPTRRPGAGTLDGDLFGDPGGIPAQVHRLFFALWPGEATRARMAQVAAGLRPVYPARWVDPSRYHVTLHFLGDHAALRADLVDAAMAAAARVHSPGFDCVLDRVGGFRGARPPCVLQPARPAPGLQQLWQDLRLALAGAGQGRGLARDFAAHATLGYGRGAPLRPASIEPVTWSVDGFVLLHSIVGQPAYHVLGTWPLARSEPTGEPGRR